VAAFTLVKPLAGICWHNFQLLVATGRAGNLRIGDYFTHFVTSGIGHHVFAGHFKSATDTASIKTNAP
jgi:hypothetical protein